MNNSIRRLVSLFIETSNDKNGHNPTAPEVLALLLSASPHCGKVTAPLMAEIQAEFTLHA